MLGIVGVVVGVIFWVAVGFGISNSKSVFDLEVGDCVELPDPDQAEVSRLQTFDCAESHGAEVFATGDLGAGDDPYPGRAEVEAMIEAECRPRFKKYVGIDFDQSELLVTTIYPQEADWERSQDYVCLAYDPDGEISKSIENAGR